ncbi:MAG: hypothetical protein IJA72_01085 [Clostridia bacterium]|nr:hypothetical protein [Clostridia bacterium]
MAKKKEDIKPVEPIVHLTDDPDERTGGAEIESLKEQIRKLQKYIDNMQQPKVPEIKEQKTKRSIKFINLCNGSIVLKGNRFWTIDGQFNSRAIPEADARVIVSTMPNLITSGMICVPDKDFLAEYDIDDSYEGVLNDKALKTLLSKNTDDIVEIYKNASDEQKNIIVDMISERKLHNQRVDANVLVEIGKLCGRDLSQIEPMED